MSEELKLCPFCGGVAKLYQHEDIGDYKIICSDCATLSTWFDTKEAAIEFWNNRVINLSGNDMVEDITAAIESYARLESTDPELQWSLSGDFILCKELAEVAVRATAIHLATMAEVLAKAIYEAAPQDGIKADDTWEEVDWELLNKATPKFADMCRKQAKAVLTAISQQLNKPKE